MTLITILFILLLVIFTLILWRIYLMRKALRLVRSINELYNLWDKRRQVIELFERSVSYKTPCEWLLIQKELFVTFTSERERINSEEKITSYIKNLKLENNHEMVLLNQLIEWKTYSVQRQELEYQLNLKQVSGLPKFVQLKTINFFQ